MTQASGSKLALRLRNRKAQVSLVSRLTLFRLGRLTTALALPLLIFLLWSHMTGHAQVIMPGLSTVLALVAAPLLATTLMLFIKLGLYGASEYVCGLLYLPLALIGGPGMRINVANTVALICAGNGRFAEAMKYFAPRESRHNIFDTINPTPWNGRQRLPELLMRMGRFAEGRALAESNLAQARRDLNDISCLQTITNLQCTLIVAATLADREADGDLVKAHLGEAAALGSSEEAASATKILASYAAGLLAVQEERFEEAAGAFENCRDQILARRATGAGAPPARNSELLGFSLAQLGTCYLKCGQPEKVEAVIQALSSENGSEPGASVDRLRLDFLQADYKMATGKADDAVKILEKAVAALIDSDSPYDQMLVEATDKYHQALIAAGQTQLAAEIAQNSKQLGIAPAIPFCTAFPTAGGAMLGLPAAVQEQALRQAESRGPAVRLPDLKYTSGLTNRSAAFFVGILAFTIFNAVYNKGDFNLSGFAAFTFLALIIFVRNLRDQVHYRKSNFFASQGIERGTSSQVVIRPETSRLGMMPSSCIIEQGPPELAGKRLELCVNDNLLEWGMACKVIANPAFQARVYLDESNAKIMALETLGRVLTVRREKPGSSTKSAEHLIAADDKPASG